MTIAWSPTPAATDDYSSDQQNYWIEVAQDTVATFGASSTTVAVYNPATGLVATHIATACPWDNLYFTGFSAISRLSDGRIVITGGRESSPELETYIGTYSAADFSWVQSSNLPVPMDSHAQTVLPDGRLFVVPVYPDPIGDPYASFVGGAYFGTVSGNVITWVQATLSTALSPFNPDMATATTLPDGRVLVAFSATEFAFATISGNSVEWAAATVTGGGYVVDDNYLQVAAQWDGSVLVSGGYNGDLDTNLDKVASGAISGDDLVLTAFDNVPTAPNEVFITPFRLSDGKVLAAYHSEYSGRSHLVVGVDSNPPPAVVVGAGDGTITTGSTAEAQGMALHSRSPVLAAGTVLEGVNPDRAPQLETGTVITAFAPYPAAGAVSTGTEVIGRAAYIVPCAAYLRTGTLISGRAAFERQTKGIALCGSICKGASGAIKAASPVVVTGSALAAVGRMLAAAIGNVANGSIASGVASQISASLADIDTGSVVHGNGDSRSAALGDVLCGTLVSGIGDATFIEPRQIIDVSATTYALTPLKQIHVEEFA